MVLLRSIASPTLNLHARGPPLIDCPQLLVQYIRSCPPYLEAVSFVRNPWTRLAVVTRDPFNMQYNQFVQGNINGNVDKFILVVISFCVIGLYKCKSKRKFEQYTYLFLLHFLRPFSIPCPHASDYENSCFQYPK
jgi:hypothetical protein